MLSTKKSTRNIFTLILTQGIFFHKVIALQDSEEAIQYSDQEVFEDIEESELDLDNDYRQKTFGLIFGGAAILLVVVFISIYNSQINHNTISNNIINNTTTNSSYKNKGITNDSNANYKNKNYPYDLNGEPFSVNDATDCEYNILSVKDIIASKEYKFNKHIIGANGSCWVESVIPSISLQIFDTKKSLQRFINRVKNVIKDLTNDEVMKPIFKFLNKENNEYLNLFKAYIQELRSSIPTLIKLLIKLQAIKGIKNKLKYLNEDQEADKLYSRSIMLLALNLYIKEEILINFNMEYVVKIIEILQYFRVDGRGCGSSDYFKYFCFEFDIRLLYLQKSNHLLLMPLEKIEEESKKIHALNDNYLKTIALYSNGHYNFLLKGRSI